MNDEDLFGKKFGCLTVLKRAPTKKGHLRWICLCECGRKTISRESRLAGHATKSCGCLARENARRAHITHGLTGTTEYIIYNLAKQRCYNPKAHEYENYGGRGIQFCEEWLGPGGFQNFMTHMGKRPSMEHTLDRWPNKNGNYEPENCRWSTDVQQNRNRRNNVQINYKGETKCLAEWIELLGLKGGTVRSRIAAGWPAEKAFEIPSITDAQKVGVGGSGRRKFYELHDGMTPSVS